ncbi:MAG: hypothetical protein LUI39_12610 [Lachnospiraceae bacterium]|nr:hypothetical protein [Lachnospiraceae bacterium]
MAARQRPWDIYEAVILLDAYLNVSEGKTTRRKAVRQVSSELRQMAKNQGMKIDETYRNENGISFQMQSMASAYCGQTISKPASKLFLSVVELYKSNHVKFKTILEEAKALIKIKQSAEADFMNYLASQVSPAQRSELYLCYPVIESFGKESGILMNGLFETIDIETISKLQHRLETSKTFRQLHAREYKKIIAAGKWYCIYICNNLYPKRETHLGIKKTLPEGRKTIIEENGLSSQDISEQTTSIKRPMKNESEESPITRTEQDERLMKKYPIIYKRLYKSLGRLSVDRLPVSTIQLQKDIENIGHVADITDVLEQASWSQNVDGGYVFSNNVVDHAVISEEKFETIEPLDENISSVRPKSNWDEIRTVDFSSRQHFAYTKPFSFSYFGDERNDFSSWTGLYIVVVTCLCEDYPDLFHSGMSFTEREGRVDLTDSRHQIAMVAPKLVPGTDYMIETNYSATDLVAKIKYMLDMCLVDYENVVITYMQRTSDDDTKDHKIQTSISARGILSDTINPKTFYHYLTETLHLAEATSRSYTSAINNCESFARAHQYEHTSLYTSDVEEAEKTAALLFGDLEFIEYNNQQHNRFRAAVKKLIPFINGGLSDLVVPREINRGEDLICASVVTSARIELDPKLKVCIDKILKDHFEDGLILNAMRLDQFRMLYEEEYGEEASQDDDELTEQLKACGILLDDRIYPVTNEKQNELLDEIRAEIIDTLRNGAGGVYLSCVLQRWNQELADALNIYDESALRELLMQENMSGVYTTENMLKLTAQSVETGEDILNYMKSCHMPVNYDQIQEDIWYIPMNRIKYILVTTPGIVNVEAETYFYAPNFPASHAELLQIRQAMEKELSIRGFLVAQDIKRLVYEACPAVAIDTAEYKDWAYRNVFSWIFRDDFEFSGAVVSEKGNELQMWQVYRKFCCEHEKLSLEELKVFAGEVGVPIYWDSVLHEMIRVDADTLIRKDKIHFDVEKTDVTLETMIPDAYVPVSEITLFLQFPTIEVLWNQFVLECYLRYYSKKFRLLQVSVSQDRVCGIITHADSEFKDYEQAVIDLLAHDNSWKNRDEALTLIVNKGCQARKRWTGFDKVLQAAIQRRAELEKRKM